VPAHWGLFSVAIAREEWLWNASPQAHQHIRGLAAKLKSIAPNRAESHTAAATIKWQDWKFAEALAEDRAATQARAACRDGRAAALCMYGFHLVQTGHPEEALAEYLMAERIDPTFPTIQHHLGHPYFVRRQFEEALAHYQKSIDLEPRHWLGYHWKGRVYEEKGDFTNAIAAFEEVERLKNPMVKTNGFYETLGEAVRQAPEHPAQAYWGKRLELALRHSTDPRYFYDIATFYARMGDRTNAYSYLKQACEKRAFSQGPLFDACWDKSDTNFQEIVRGIGLSVPVPR
jgi:tetratricopeptide (TPR) repeat protein